MRRRVRAELAIGRQSGGWRGRWKGTATKPSELKADGNEKSGIIHQVAFPQAPRLLAEAVGPLESRVFDPLRGVFHVPGVNVKSCTHPDHYFARKPAAVVGHKPFLLCRGVALYASNPNGRRAMGGYEEGLIENSPELGIALRLHHAVHASSTNISLPSFVNGTFDNARCAEKVDRVNADAKHVSAVLSRRCARCKG